MRQSWRNRTQLRYNYNHTRREIINQVWLFSVHSNSIQYQPSYSLKNGITPNKLQMYCSNVKNSPLLKDYVTKLIEDGFEVNMKS